MGLWLMFWGWKVFWVRSDRWFAFGLKSPQKQKRVDWFYLDDKGFFIHVKVACGLCHDDHSFLPLEFCVSGKKIRHGADLFSEYFSSCSSHPVAGRTSWDSKIESKTKVRRNIFLVH